MQRGLLLINLGTPNSADVSAVKNYLREFLTDKRVIDLPAILRYLLVHVFILPFRAKRSAEAYESIWTDQGSPLLYHSLNLVPLVQETLGSDYKVALGMRYGKPSIESALNSLKDCDTLTILPVYPQYSSAASGSAIEESLRLIRSWEVIPSIHVIRDFFQNAAYIKTQAELIKEYRQQQEYVLFSYHGIPERQLVKTQCPSLCVTDCPPFNEQIKTCYRAQCFATSQLLAQELQLDDTQYETAFQSRLGRTPWIKPYTDDCLMKLAQRGIKKILVVCPSFVADCLETIEEIGIRAQKQWLSLGGEQLILVPSLNEHPLWIKALAELTKVVI